MRLIDADALDGKLEALAKKYAAQGRFEAAKDYSFVQTVLLSAPTIHPEELRPKGRWIINQESDDGFKHHCCSRCKVDAVFHYEYRDDLDEDMDGEWFVCGQIECGIVEELSNYCHNCGAKMEEPNDET